ncbi:MAG TPA: hypothetical protein VKF32_10770, partial [Thermoanaerobaculia bacterium]|nr:hypothetical protein [Thermoanaerobaculia bacterium]
RDPAVLDWRQTLVREELSALGAAWFEAREEILRTCESEQKPFGSFFRAGDDHLSDLGNRATFQTIARGIASLER